VADRLKERFPTLSPEKTRITIHPEPIFSPTYQALAENRSFQRLRLLFPLPFQTLLMYEILLQMIFYSMKAVHLRAVPGLFMERGEEERPSAVSSTDPDLT
jgi:hypothetical protein